MELEQMPVLRPIPIPTKNKNWLVGLVNWIFRIRKWRLEEDWKYTIPGGPEVIIWEGFEFDGASIPRIFWFFLSPTGLLLIPAILHDYAYVNHYLPQLQPDDSILPYGLGKKRSFWDRMFRDVAIAVNGFKIINRIAWLAVVLFGWVSYRKWDRLHSGTSSSDIDGAE